MERKSGWLDIGGLLSNFEFYDFKRLRVRTLTIGDLAVLRDAVEYKNLDTLVMLMQDKIDQDIYELLEMDFIYLMFWIKTKSFPESPMTLTWTCTNYPIHHQGYPTRYARDPALRKMNSHTLKRIGYERTQCGKKNTEIVRQFKQNIRVMPEGTRLPKGYKFPRVRDMLEAQELKEDHNMGELADLLTWFDTKTVKEAMEVFDWEDQDSGTTIERLRKLREDYNYGVGIAYTLTCFKCGHKYNIDEKDPSIWDIFPRMSTNAVVDMQYNIMAQFNAYLDETTPTMKFLYWHSLYVKHRKEQEEERKKRESLKGKKAYGGTR